MKTFEVSPYMDYLHAIVPAYWQTLKTPIEEKKAATALMFS